MRTSWRLSSCCYAIFWLLSSSVVAQDCYLKPEIRDEQSWRNIQYSLNNITCIVNTAYLQLYYNRNTSSVPFSNRAILTTIANSQEFLNATTPMPSEAGGTFWGDALDEVTFNFEQWASFLVMYRTQLSEAGLAASLPDQIRQQQDSVRGFAAVLQTKVYETQRQIATNRITPVYGYLDCVIQAFSTAGSQVTACPTTSIPSGTVGGAATSTTSTPGGTSTNVAADPRVLAATAVPYFMAMAIVAGNGLL